MITHKCKRIILLQEITSMIERVFISTISYDLKNAIKDCLLSLFFRKKDLIDFLYTCASTKSNFSGENESLKSYYEKNIEK